MSDLVLSNIICFQTQKQLTTLNNIWVVLKSVLIDLHARNFVHAKTSLRARCVHACHCVRNLLSPVNYTHHIWTYHTKTSTQMPLAQSSKGAPQTLNCTSLSPPSPNKSWRHTSKIFFNPVIPNWITSSRISKSPQTRYLKDTMKTYLCYYHTLL